MEKGGELDGDVWGPKVLPWSSLVSPYPTPTVTCRSQVCSKHNMYVTWHTFLQSPLGGNAFIQDVTCTRWGPAGKSTPFLQTQGITESFGYAGIGRAEKANEMTGQGAISTCDGLNVCPLPNSCWTLISKATVPMGQLMSSNGRSYHRSGFHPPPTPSCLLSPVDPLFSLLHMHHVPSAML